MCKRVRGFHEPGRFYLGEKRPHCYLPGFAALNGQSTRHGARPGSMLAPWCTCAPPRAPSPRVSEKDPRPDEKHFCILQSTIRFIYFEVYTCGMPCIVQTHQHFRYRLPSIKKSSIIWHTVSWDRNFIARKSAITSFFYKTSELTHPIQHLNLLLLMSWYLSMSWYFSMSWYLSFPARLLLWKRYYCYS